MPPWSATIGPPSAPYSTFRGPLMQVQGADRFIEGIKQFQCQAAFKDVQMMEQGDTVMSFFTFEFSQPFTGTFRMAERVTLRDGKLQSSELIYDARAFPGALPA
jgi:hypothetical protein